MDAQLKELIEKIKAEGVAQAQAQAQVLLEEAQRKADHLVSESQAKAEALVAQARSEAQRFEASSRDAVKQASRDLVLSLEKKILALFQAATKEAVDAALVPSLVEKLTLELARAWANQGDAGIQVVLSSPDAQKLGEALRTSLAKTVKGGVEVIPSERFSRGVRVSGQGSALTVDLTSGALADLLAETLQPALAESLREAVR